MSTSDPTILRTYLLRRARELDAPDETMARIADITKSADYDPDTRLPLAWLDDDEIIAAHKSLADSFTDDVTLEAVALLEAEMADRAAYAVEVLKWNMNHDGSGRFASGGAGGGAGGWRGNSRGGSTEGMTHGERKIARHLDGQLDNGPVTVEFTHRGTRNSGIAEGRAGRVVTVSGKQGTGTQHIDIGEIHMKGGHLDYQNAPRVAGVLKEFGSVPIAKADDARRFSLAPLYSPDTHDAHSEWTDGDTLQKGLWEYVRTTGAERTINLQHSGKPAGEWVEAVTWPYEVTATLTIPNHADGVEKAREVTLPANTSYLGVVWEPWAWDLVKSGKLRGLSLGGSARKIEADFDVKPEDVA